MQAISKANAGLAQLIVLHSDRLLFPAALAIALIVAVGITAP